MEEKNAEENIKAFNYRQKYYSYENKVIHARNIINEFIRETRKRGLNTHVSVGGLDSITLLCFLRDLGHDDIPAISASHLEDVSIRKIHKQLGVEHVKPLKIDEKGKVTKDPKGKTITKPYILQNFGFPVLSKEKAAKIETLQNPTEDNKTVRHAIITGETGEYGGYQKDSRMKLPQKWLKLFGGYENEAESCEYGMPDFKVSAKCCYYLKEKPCDDWATEHNSVPFLGMMASEGGRREKALKMNGCNYYGETVIRSCPFAIFSRQDLLQLALDLRVPVPEIYGEIVRDEDGTLRTTGAQRTGCEMCGFGIHIEQRPHRFDRMRLQNEKKWKFWMYECCTDEITGEKYGWGRVLEYLGIEWEQPPYIQMGIDDYLKGAER
ncbi:MAG: hypothetical protein IJH37_13075 [Clostridia bacterium]|nr:hypothetical protein [Clostridia bacterium]